MRKRVPERKKNPQRVGEPINFVLLVSRLILCRLGSYCPRERRVARDVQWTERKEKPNRWKDDGKKEGRLVGWRRSFSEHECRRMEMKRSKSDEKPGAWEARGSGGGRREGWRSARGSKFVNKAS